MSVVEGDGGRGEGEFAERGVTKIEQVQTRGRGNGSKFWSFCENVKIE